MKFEVGFVTDMAGDTFKLFELPKKENGGRMKYEVTMQKTPLDLIMPLHSHLEMTETTAKSEGEMSIFTGGRYILVGPREYYPSLPGTPHIGRNPGTSASRFFWPLTPEDSIVPSFQKTVGDYWGKNALLAVPWTILPSCEWNNICLKVLLEQIM